MFYLVPLIFFCIAFVFSMLGLGGSGLYIPILYWMGLDFKTEAIPLGMLLNVVNSATAATTYTIKKIVDWRAALPFAVTMLILPAVGALLNAQIPTKPLIGFFAVFTAIAATLMLSGWKPKRGKMSSKGRITSRSIWREYSGTCCRHYWAWWRFFYRALALYRRSGGKSRCGHLRICGHLLGRVEFHCSLGHGGKAQLGYLGLLCGCCVFRQRAWLSYYGRETET